MLKFTVKIIKFENPTSTWYQLKVVRYFMGIPYWSGYHSTGYGVHSKPVKFDTVMSAKESKEKLYKRIKDKYYTKTTETIVE